MKNFKEYVKEAVKKFSCEIVYFAYRSKLMKNHIRVMSIDETIKSMIDTDKSLVRFGDAEINIIEGRTTKFQQYDGILAERLADILSYKEDAIIVAIPDIFESLRIYPKKSAKFWKEHLFFSRKTYEKYCNPNKCYANAFFSRLYYMYKDKTQSGVWFAKVKEIWKNRDIVIIEGETTHTGVGNNLLDNAGRIERILCPPHNAYLAYENIRQACLKVEKNRLLLVSIGNSAKLLVVDLVREGYRAIDIGNMDMEYEWYLQQASGKTDIPKHSIMGERENLEAGYEEYWKQIREIIKLEGTC